MRFFKTTVFLFLTALLLQAFSARPALAEDFLRPEVESRIRQMLPNLEVSISEVSSGARGVRLNGITVSKDGQKVATAKSIFMGYRFMLSATFFKSLISSTRVDVEGVEIFTLGGFGTSFSGGLPVMNIKDSSFILAGRRIEIRRLEVSSARRGGQLRVFMKNGEVSVPHLKLSVSGLNSESTITSGESGLSLGGVKGGGKITTPRGEAQTEFEFSASDKKDLLWSGGLSLSLSEITAFRENVTLSLSSVTLGTNGEILAYGSVSTGLVTSNIRVKLETAPGGMVPRFAANNPFEIEGDVLKGTLNVGGVMFAGSVKKNLDRLFISAQIPENYYKDKRARDRLDLFGIGLLESGFSLSFKGNKIDAGSLFIKSPKLFVDTKFETADGDVRADYTIESEDIFYVSDLARALKLYRMSGALKSSGSVERENGGETTVSGILELQDFSATFGRRMNIGSARFDFQVPLNRFSLEKFFVRALMRDVSYSDMFAKEADISFESGDTYAKMLFGGSRSLTFAAGVERAGDDFRAEIEKMEIKAGSSGLSLSRSFGVTVSQQRAEIDGEAVMYGPNAFLRFSGFYAYGQNPEIKLTSSLLGVNTEMFEPFLPGLKAHRGIVGGEITLDGLPGWPVVNLKLNYEGALANADLSLVRAGFSERLAFSLRVDEAASGRSLSIVGGLSSGGEENPQIRKLMFEPSNYDLTLKAKKFSIRPVRFLYSKIRGLEGYFSGEFSVFNTEDGINIDGAVEIDTAKVKVGDWTKLMEITSGRLDFKWDKIVSSIELRDNSGSAGIEGTFGIRDFAYRYEANLKGLHLHVDQIYSGFYGDLFIDGKGRKIRVRAKDLKTKGAEIWLRTDYDRAAAGIVYTDTDTDAVFAQGKKHGFFYIDSDMDFHLTISEDTEFRLDRVNSILGGRIHILKIPGDEFISVTGGLKMLRGSYSMLGRQFVIDKGDISFSSREYLSPVVDINALYERRGLTVTVSLSGEANNLKLGLTSVPAMKEDDIILALLDRRSGRTATRNMDVLDAVVDKERGYSAFGYVADEVLSSSVEDNPFSFVDVFNITPTDRGLFKAEVEIGTYLTDRLYTTYERVNETLPITASYKSRFSVQYTLSDYFTIEGVAGGITPGANLLFNIDFR
ncbi:MAG: translocation/assembly module TamB domain-containing protein [Thermodesulfobacteriota bacterium]